MGRKLILAFVACSFVFTACSSKKKADGDAGAADSAIDERPIQFDPQGSDSGNIDGLSTVYFEYDQATLTPETREKLSQNAEWIRRHGNVTMQIEGHADERGSIEYNLSLGERRAKAVKNYLVGLGIDANRLTIISYGEEKPLIVGSAEESFAKNRRANFVPLPQ